jgi:N-acetylneuraminic acid mutarotase
MLIKKNFYTKLFFTFLLLIANPLMASCSPSAWNDLNPSSAPSIRFGASMVFNPSDGQILLFGGQSSPDGTLLNDTWVYDVQGNIWNMVSPPSSPSPRDGCTMVFDPSTGQVILFGGFDGTNHIGETWTYGYDIATNNFIWTNVTPSVSPSPRNAPSMAFDSSSGQVVLFGGYSTLDLNDTWLYDSKANTWTEVSPLTSPQARDSSSMTFDPCRGQIVLFGGYSNGSNLNDTWAFNTLTNTWTNLTTPSSPPARFGSSMDFNPCIGQIILFGGGVYPGSYLDDTWVFNSSTNDWQELTLSGNPGAREFANIAFNPINGSIILFGGVNNDNDPQAFGDTWEIQ